MTDQDEAAGGPSGYVLIPEGVLLQHVADETVLLHLESGEYYGLDPIGTRMVDLACELPSPADVVEQLVTEYDATSEVLQRDLKALLAEMAGKGLVTWRGDADQEADLAAGAAPGASAERGP